MNSSNDLKTLQLQMQSIKETKEDFDQKKKKGDKRRQDERSNKEEKEEETFLSLAVLTSSPSRNALAFVF